MKIEISDWSLKNRSKLFRRNQEFWQEDQLGYLYPPTKTSRWTLWGLDYLAQVGSRLFGPGKNLPRDWNFRGKFRPHPVRPILSPFTKLLEGVVYPAPWGILYVPGKNSSP